MMSVGQVGRQVPGHEKAAEGEAEQEKTPEVDLAQVFRIEEQVLGAQVLTHDTGHEEDQDQPQRQYQQVATQMEQQQADGKGIK